MHEAVRMHEAQERMGTGTHELGGKGVARGPHVQERVEGEAGGSGGLGGLPARARGTADEVAPALERAPAPGALAGQAPQQHCWGGGGRARAMDTVGAMQCSAVQCCCAGT